MRICVGLQKKGFKMKPEVFKVFISSVSVLACALIVQSAAWAESYECKTQQAFKWEAGIIEPDTFIQKEVLEFNDETGVLSIEENKSGVFVPTQMSIIKRLGADTDMVATYTHDGGNYFNNWEFRMRSWDQKVGLVFIFKSSDERISSGSCSKKHV